MLKLLDSSQSSFADDLQGLLSATDEPDPDIVETVLEIISAVRMKGDEALLEYTNRFDRRKVSINQIEIPLSELQEALQRIPEQLKLSLEHAAARVRDFHERQKQSTWTYEDKEGNTLGQKVTPLDRVGVYVPGGKAAYPSSVLMNIIPAKVAGVEEIIMVVPTPDEEKNDLVQLAVQDYLNSKRQVME